MQLLPMGPTAVLVEDPPGDPAAWSLALRSLDMPGVIDVVPAARTVLIRCSDAHSLAIVTGRLPGEPLADDPSTGAFAEVVVPVDYDGPDLDAVAASVRLVPDAVVALHTGARFTVAFCGFAPGFAYLRGLPPRLHLPRRDTPRTRVPAGSVAIADEYSAIYPTASPGGWHLIGSTDLELFDSRRSPPALLSPGTGVRFVAV